MRNATAVKAPSIAAALVLLCLPAAGAGEDTAGAGPAGGASAVWASRELRFVFQGFTAQYSCDGLRDRLTDLLLQLGARADLEVRESGCTSLGSPDPFPGVRIRMHVLQPAAAGDSAASVPAHWKRIDLTPRGNGLAAGECELIEQVKSQILPLFATRNVEYGSNCQPHQLQVGAIRLRAEVLVADPNPAAAAQ